MKIASLDLSGIRRCFVVGEVSGHFHVLQDLLREQDFDPYVDHLILNGNFSGYCISSRELTAWIDKPWVTSLLGSSEIDALARLNGQEKPSLSGQWLGMITPKERARIKDCLSNKPLVAELDSQDGTIIVSPSTLAIGSTWSDIKSELSAQKGLSSDRRSFFSSRKDELQVLGVSQVCEKQEYGVEDVKAVISTFRDQGAGEKLGQSSNRYFLISSSHMNHGNKYQHSCILPYIELNSFFDNEDNNKWLRGKNPEQRDCQKMNFSLKQQYITVR